MRTIVWLVGVAFVALGAVLLFAPTFGFETIAADRTADVETAADEHALVGFEPAGGSIDAPDDEATVFRLRNNAGESLTLSNSHRLSIDGLAIDSTGEATVEPGSYSAVSVSCGDYRGTDTATLTVTVDEARGTSVSVTSASSMTSFLADCDVPAIVWNATADWDAGSDDRTVSDDVGDRESDTVRLGYGPDEAGLVGYWPLDGDGGPAVDASGNGNDGTLVNSPTTGATGVLDSTSYDFDASSQAHVNVSDDPALELSGEDSATVSAWIKLRSQNTNGFTAITQKANEGYVLQLQNGNQPGFAVHDGGYNNAWSGQSLNTGEWYHLVGTYDGDTARIYVDGTEYGSSSGIGQMSDTSGWGVGIAKNLQEDGRYFDGAVDEVRIYDRGLSAAEVRNLYYTADNGTHTTDWRSTSVDLHHDRLVLQNVTATLGTTDATVYVESDPDHDGAVNETSDPIALSEGVAEYDVTGIENDTDRVRLSAEFETDDVTRTPIVSRADLTEVYSNFTVAIDDVDHTVVEGEDVAVDVTVENTGSDPDTQTLELRDLDGDVVDSTEVQLDARSSTTTTLTWTTQPGDSGSGDVTVASDDATATRSVTVRAQANFDVAIDGTNSPANEGEDLTVDVTVENTGDVTDAQTIRLEDFGGTQVDATNVTLAGGQTNDSIELAWPTQHGDNGTGSVTVRSDDDSDSVQASVNQVFEFDSCRTIDADGTWILTDDISHSSGHCIVLGTDEATIEGQNHTVDMAGTSDSAVQTDRYGQSADYRIRNLTVDGGGGGVELKFVDHADVDSVTVTGAQRAFHVETQDGSDAAGDFSIVDSTAYGVGNQLVNVRGQATDLVVRRLAAGDPTGNGSTLDFEVHPTDDYQPTEIVEVDDPASPPAGNVSLQEYVGIATSNDPLENVTLYYDAADVAGADESTVALWHYDSGQSAWARQDSTVATENDTVSVGQSLSTATDYGLFAAERPTFDVAIDDTSEPLDEGEPLDVNVTVENLGDREDTQTIELRDFEGTVVDTTDVTLDAGETDSSVTLTWQTEQGNNGTDDVTVSSATDTATRQVQIGDGSEYEVTIDQVHEPVIEGQDLDVDVTVENVGEQAGTQTIRLLDFDGTVVDSTEVSLDPATSDSLTLTWTTETGDAGNGTLEVTSADEVATASATVKQPATFDVTVDGTNSPVAEGDDLDVDATVENTGDVEGTQTVRLEDLAGSQVDSETMTLSPDEQRSITFTWATQDGDNGTGDVTVSSENDSDVAPVTVEDITFLDSCTQITEDGVYHLNASFGYSGSGACIDVQTDQVTLRGQGHTIDMGATSENVFYAHRYNSGGDFIVRNLTILGGNEAFHIYFVDHALIANVTVDGAGDGVLAYNEEGQNDIGNVTVRDSAFYGIGTNPLLANGDATDLSAERATIGDPTENGTTLDFEVHPSSSQTTIREVDSPSSPPAENVSVGSYFSVDTYNDPLQNVAVHYDDADVSDVDESTLALWQWDGAASAWTQLDATVDAENDTVSVGQDLTTATDYGLLASEPPAFDVAVQSTTSPVTEGEDLEVTVDVTNNDDATDTQTVELADFDGTVVDQTNVQVAAGATETVTLTWSTEGGDEGSGDVTVASPSDSDTASVEVQDGSTFDVAIAQAHDDIVEGEDLDVDVNVTNDGSVTDRETVELERFDGTVVDSTDVTLGANETNSSVTLTWQTEQGDSGTGEVNVTSDEDVATQQVTIDQQATFDVAITGANDPVMEGEDLTVDVEVTNTGDRTGTQTVALDDFAGQQVDATDVTLGAGQTNSSITLVWSTGDGDGGTDDVTVRSDDASATQTVQIEQPAHFDVAIDGTSSPVDEGQDLTVDVNVTNTGDYSGTQTVELTDFGGTVVDSTSVTLGAGKSDSSIALTWSTEVGDNGTDDVTVASDDTTATVTVDVEKDLQPGDFDVENVDPHVAVSDDANQTITYVLQSSEEDSYRIELANAQGDGIDYEASGDSTPGMVVEGPVASRTWVSESYLTGVRFTMLDEASQGDVVTLTLSDYATSSDGGPWTVEIQNTDTAAITTDTFEIG